MSKCQSLGRSATAYGCEVTLELDTGVDRVGLLITGLHMQVASTSKYSEYRPLFTTQDERTIVTYVMDVLRPLGYWTQWMSTRNTVTLHHDIVIYNNTFHYIGGVMQVLAKKMTQWMDHLFFAMKLAQQKLSK
jgi:hypothetical protein